MNVLSCLTRLGLRGGLANREGIQLLELSSDRIFKVAIFLSKSVMYLHLGHPRSYYYKKDKYERNNNRRCGRLAL